jgi:hypothetical protein
LKVATRGRVAQLGERIVRNDEVAGSIPVSSTKFTRSPTGYVPRKSALVSSTKQRFTLLSNKWVGDLHAPNLLSILKIFAVESVALPFDGRSYNK